MRKKLLIIGGTYFTGRVFSILAAREGHELTFINRGKYSMKSLGNVREFACDRHDIWGLGKLPLEVRYDAVIDFCAYESRDISLLYENLPCTWKQYIYLSTADVYARADGVKTEQSGLLQEKPDDEVGLYTYKKMLLERELMEESRRRGNAYTILRPAFIFGPYNYAPRESWYIQNIVKGNPVVCPRDAEGLFQLVYVKDAAQAILLCISGPEARNEVFNLSAPEVMNYDKYMDVLKKVSDRQIKTVSITAEEAVRKRIPLPFPLTKEESELFDGSKITRRLGLVYSDLTEAMRSTYQAFKGVYEILDK